MKAPLPVVFVHGAAGSPAVWKLQLAHLKGRRRAYALDLRGHGGPAVAADGAIFTTAADLEAAVARLQLDRFALVGHSMGAWAAIEYAGRHPERVAGLLLVDPSGDYRAQADKDAQIAQIQDPKKRLEFWDAMLAGAKPATRELVLADLARTPPATFAAFARELFAYDPVSALARYPGPKLTVVSPCGEEPEGLHRRIPTLPRETFKGVSHWIMLDDPAGFDAVLDGFLAPLERGAPAGSGKAIVEAYMEAFRRLDHAAVLALLADDVEWVIPGAFRRRGKAAFDQEIENPAFQGRPDIRTTRLVEEGGVVVAEGTVRARKATGEAVDIAFCDVFELREGRIAKLTSYLMELKGGAGR